MGPMPGAPVPMGPSPQDRVGTPGTLLLVHGILTILIAGFSLLSRVLGFGMMAATDSGGYAQYTSGAMGIVFNIIYIGVGGLIIYASGLMKQLRNHGLCVGAAVLSVIPCTSCCLSGIPIGIWCLVVLLDANVKAAFRA